MIDLVRTIEELINRLKPDVIYTHHAGDLNIGHRVVNCAVLTATRPVPGCPVKEVYTFETPSSTEWAFHQIEPHFKPNVFCSIDNSLEIKLKALALYESEVRPFPHPRSQESLRANARRWGSVIGVEYAEPFELIRSVR